MLRIEFIIFGNMISFTGIASNSLVHNSSSNGYGVTTAQPVERVSTAEFNGTYSCWKSPVEDMHWSSYWMVDLESNYYIPYVNLTNRIDYHVVRPQRRQVRLFAANPLDNLATTSSVCTFVTGLKQAAVTPTIACMGGNTSGRFFRVTGLNRRNYYVDKLHVCEVVISGNPLQGTASNSLAHKKPTFSSSNGFNSTSAQAVDGNFNPYFDSKSCWESAVGDKNPWWMVDLEDTFNIGHVNITNRAKNFGERLHSVQVVLYADNPLHHSDATYTICAFFPGTVGAGATQTISCSTGNATGRYLRVFGLNRKNDKNVFHICEITVSELKLQGIASNSLALNKPTYTSSNGIGSSPARAADGNFSPLWNMYSCWESAVGDMNPYWMVDLGSNYSIDYVNITNRADCCGERLHSVQLLLYAENPNEKKETPSTLCALFPGPVEAGATQTIACEDENATGRFLKVNGLNRTSKDDVLHLCEVAVSGIALPGTTSNYLAQNKPTYSSSNYIGSSAATAVDGNFNPESSGHSCWESAVGDMYPFWMVDLEDNYYIHYVNITNRVDCCAERLHSIQVMLYAENPLLNSEATPTLCGFFPGPVGAGATQTIPCVNGNATGRYMKVNGLNRTSGYDIFHMCEITVSGFKRSALKFKSTRKINYARQGKLLNALQDRTQTSLSLTHCGTRCTLDGDCYYFRHDGSTGECHLYIFSFGDHIDCLPHEFCYAGLELT